MDTERLVEVRVEEQDTPHAALEIVNETAHTVFTNNVSGSRGTGSSALYHDEITPTLIGPGTGSIIMSQTVNTDNVFNVIVELEESPQIPGDDYAAGVWSDGEVEVGGTTSGSITHAGQDVSIRDNDWLKVDIPAEGKNEIRAVPQGNNGTRPIMLLHDETRAKTGCAVRV